MGFQKIVLIIALVILTGCIIFIASMISSNEANKKWPPEVGTCPPYYESKVDETGDLICDYIREGPASIDINSICKSFPIGSETKGTPCKKCCWAKNCGIQWDGVSGNCDKINGCSCN